MEPVEYHGDPLRRLALHDFRPLPEYPPPSPKVRSPMCRCSVLPIEPGKVSGYRQPD